MSKALSVKMDEAVFQAAERSVKRCRMSRNAYINKAVRLLNLLEERKWLRGQLRKESSLVRDESEKVLREFENIQDEGLE